MLLLQQQSSLTGPKDSTFRQIFVNQACLNACFLCAPAESQSQRQHQGLADAISELPSLSR